MSSGDFTEFTVLQSFFSAWDESQTSTDLPTRVSKAAQNGDVHTVRRWLAAGGSPEEVARSRLTMPIYTGDGIPESPMLTRRPGAVEAFLALLADVRAAGSFKRYANAPRLDIVVLQALCAKGRAAPPPALERLFPTSTKSVHLPKEIFWRILSYWRTDRDP